MKKQMTRCWRLNKLTWRKGDLFTRGATKLYKRFQNFGLQHS
uniref:Uncharacterized protein n=1 Tax=Picea sitchensis TaxID=3332 RepID=A9NKF5_PICSI|nr:unknown [Picea sitchensis]ABK21624.1 unknown [Picea sitchensis]